MFCIWFICFFLENNCSFIRVFTCAFASIHNATCFNKQVRRVNIRINHASKKASLQVISQTVVVMKQPAVRERLR